MIWLLCIGIFLLSHFSNQKQIQVSTMKICQGKKYLYLIVLKKQTGVIVLFINFKKKKNIWELWLCLVFQVWSVYLLDMYYSHLVWHAATFQPGNLHVWSRTVPIALSKCILRDHLEVCWCVNVSELWGKALMCVHKFSAPPPCFLSKPTLNCTPAPMDEASPHKIQVSSAMLGYTSTTYFFILTSPFVRFPYDAGLHLLA